MSTTIDKKVSSLPFLVQDGTYSPNTFTYVFREELINAKLPPFPCLEDWVKIFYNSVASFKRIAEEDPSIEDENDRNTRAMKFQDGYITELDEMMDQISLDGLCQEEISSRCNCLELCKLRQDPHTCFLPEQYLRASGFSDPFLPIKKKENDKALSFLPEILSEIDAEQQLNLRWELIIRGICAANIFDLGAPHTTDLYHSTGGVSFHDTREKLLERPWVIDTMDNLVTAFSSRQIRYKKAYLFVDNSGSDIVLGMIPFARELLRQFLVEKVVLTANEKPSINDITAAELDALFPRISSIDDVLCKAISTGKLVVVSSGNDLPVIDLSCVSQELAEEAADDDAQEVLVVLEGMGRSIETNLNAKLSCDCLKIGMVKHQEVAAALGGRMLDCVVKFERSCKNQ